MKTLKTIDVCSGAGGWAVAARGLPIKIVAAFDVDEVALSTYKLNHPDVECVQCDVREKDFSEWRGIDLILGGIPCEEVSPARNMMKPDTETMAEWTCLVETCVGLHKEVDAIYWCFEDVRQVVHHAPLFTPHFLLDSQDYCGQRRIRAYLGNCPKPAAGGDSRTLKDYVRPGPFRLNPVTAAREPTCSEVYKNGFYPWMMDEIAPTVIGNTSRRDAYMAIEYGDGWRNVEWQESAVLQGFPEDYVFMGTPTSVAKLVGQAVQIDTARAILDALCAEAINLD